jgi:hypothetical protein
VAARDERLAGNEALFREVNERVAEVATHFFAIDNHEAIDFICECARAECTELIPMSAAEYEAIRVGSTRFAVVPGHEDPEIERIIARRPAYLVVEKRDEEAQEVARETDPRA